MVATVTCPTCGHKCPAPDAQTGKDARCPSCLNSLPTKEAPPSSLLNRTLAGDAAPSPNRTVLAQAEATIRYNCPRCKKLLESPASFAGQKLHCPDCNQRLQVPQPSAPPPPPVNKTILATEHTGAPTVTTPPPPVAPPPPAPRRQEVEEDEVEKAPKRRENCLECGVDLTRRSRVQTCPDCGSTFCSAACFREHHYYAHAPEKKKKKKRSREEECDHCGSTRRPYVSQVVSQNGWAVFVILLIFFFPLCWIGLLMTENQLRCRDCGIRLD